MRMFGLKTTQAVVQLLLIACLLNCDWGVAQKSSANDSVTFNQDIGPIIHEKCSRCHRPGQAGAFS